jgi:hypothetical protein
MYIFKVTLPKSNILHMKHSFLCLLSSGLLDLFKMDKDLPSFLFQDSVSSGNEN